MDPNRKGNTKNAKFWYVLSCFTDVKHKNKPVPVHVPNVSLHLDDMAGKARILATWEYEEANREHQLRQLSLKMVVDLLTDDLLCVEPDSRIYEDFMDWCDHQAGEKGDREGWRESMLILLQHQR